MKKYQQTAIPAHRRRGNHGFYSDRNEALWDAYQVGKALYIPLEEGDTIHVAQARITSAQRQWGKRGVRIHSMRTKDHRAVIAWLEKLPEKEGIR